MLRVPFILYGHKIKPTWRWHFRLPPLRTVREGQGTHPIFCANDLKAGPPVQEEAFRMFTIVGVVFIDCGATRADFRVAGELSLGNYFPALTRPFGSINGLSVWGR